MSDPQIQEPPTSGRVSFRTTKGNLDIELWSRECPLACRNFVQLCKEGYYNGSIFHRIIKDFLVQTGDPSGSGSTCESVFGEPFADEVNQRLRYRYRGMVGVANAGKGTNGSQFFITLGPQEGLNGKNTLFGRVVGSSIYTVVDISEVEVDINDRPASDFPPKILECVIIDDPFPEVGPRQSEKVQSVNPDQSEELERSKLIKAKRTNILSFSNEEEAEGGITADSSQEERITHVPERRMSRARGELDLDEYAARRIADAAVLEEIAMIENELRSLSSSSKPATAEPRRPSLKLEEDLLTSSGKRKKEDKGGESVVKQLKSWAKKVSTSSLGGGDAGENVGSGDWLKSVGKVKLAVDSKNAFKIL